MTKSHPSEQADKLRQKVRDRDKQTEQNINIPCAQLSCYQTDIMHINV